MIKLFYLLLICCTVLYSQQNEINFISWNIQDFGKTKDNKEIEQIAKIVKEADIIAIQEVVGGYGGPQAVARLWDQLNRTGASWDYAISDKTNSPKYMNERYAFLWKNKNIKIKDRGHLVKLDTVVYREPFSLDFYVKDKKISILNYHARRHNLNPSEEIKVVLDFVKDNHNNPIILAGDFNEKSSAYVFHNFLINDGYDIAINNKKTVLKRSCKGSEYKNHAIDNIFYSNEIEVLESKVIDFVGFCDRLSLARQLSDHLPVFMRFKI